MCCSANRGVVCAHVKTRKRGKSSRDRQLAAVLAGCCTVCCSLFHGVKSARVVSNRDKRGKSWRDRRLVAGVSQCAAACCSLSQCVAMCCNVFYGVESAHINLRKRGGFWRDRQLVAVCCSVLQCVAVCFVVLCLPTSTQEREESLDEIGGLPGQVNGLEVLAQYFVRRCHVADRRALWILF